MSAATIVAPRTIDEAADLVREFARARRTVLVTGGGTKRTWTREPRRVDVELSTRALSGVVAYEPGDGVITALAGTPWRELGTLVARHGHHLSPSIAAADRATVGGVVAAGQSGFERLRFGPLRDHVLGMRVVTADGTIAKTGGRLVKNVTGFDLHRLHTGAHGTLGLVAEVSLRLHAAPETRAIGLAFQPTRERALATARAAIDASRAAWHVSVGNRVDGRSPERWMVRVLLGGSAALVASEVAALRVLVPDVPWMVEGSGARDAERLPTTWSAVASDECVGGRWAPLRVTCPVTRVDDVLAELGTEAVVEAQPGLGIVDAWIRDLDAARVGRVSSAMIRAGARVHWRGLDDDLRARVDLHGGEEPAGLALMRRIRANLDPADVFASGRLAGGL